MRLPCYRTENAHLDAFPVYANGPTGLVAITVQNDLGDHLTVHVEAQTLGVVIHRAHEAWSCSHEPRCADSACSDNPAMRQWATHSPDGYRLCRECSTYSDDGRDVEVAASWPCALTGEPTCALTGEPT